MKRRRHIVLLVLGMLTGPLAAWTQADDSTHTTSLETVIIRVRRSIPYGVAAKSVKLDSAAKQEFQHGNLADVMALEPSVYMKGYGVAGIATPAFRGTGAGHTQVYWNGLPLNASGLGLTDFSLVSPHVADDLHLVFGLPSLSLGSGGLGGAIALSNEPFAALDFPDRGKIRQRLSQQVGSFGESRSAYRLHAGNRQVQSGTHLNFNTARNDFPFPNTALPGAPEQRQVNAGFRQFSGLQSLRLNTSARSQLEASAWVYDTDRDLPPTMLTVNAGERQRDRGIRTRLAWNHRLREDHEIGVQAGWFRESLVYENPLASIHSVSRSERFIAEGTVRTDHAYPNETNWLLQDLQVRVVHDRMFSGGFPVPRDFSQASVSGGGALFLNDRLNFYLRLREEWTSRGWSPLLGMLGWEAWWRGTSLYLNGGRNYRVPTLNDLYWEPGGNPDLLPEQSLAMEGGVKHRGWLPGGQKRVLYGSIHGYLNRVDNWILWVPGSTAWWAPENVAEVTVHGLEVAAGLESRTRDLNSWKVDLELSYSLTSSKVTGSTDPNDQSLGKQLIYTPVHTGQAFVRLRRRFWHLRYQQGFTGPRFTTRDNSGSVEGYTVGNLHLGRYFRLRDHRLVLQAGVSNILNARYQNIAWRAMPGRSFFVRVQWEFEHEKQ